MKSTLFLAAALALAATPAFAHPHDGPERHMEMLRIDPEEFRFEMSGFKGTRLGVHVSTMTEELREAMGAPKTAGILVNRVVADSPAAKAGVKPGDVLVEVAGEEIAGTGDVWKALADTEGDVAVEVIRDKRRVNLTAKVEKATDLRVIHPFGGRDVDALQKRIDELEKRLEKLEKKR